MAATNRVIETLGYNLHEIIKLIWQIADCHQKAVSNHSLTTRDLEY